MCQNSLKKIVPPLQGNFKQRFSTFCWSNLTNKILFFFIRKKLELDDFHDFQSYRRKSEDRYLSTSVSVAFRLHAPLQCSGTFLLVVGCFRRSFLRELTTSLGLKGLTLIP